MYELAVCISPVQFENVVNKILDDYKADVIEAVGSVVKKTGEYAKKKLQENSPKDTGIYAKCWRTGDYEYSALGGHITVFVMPPFYRLTHLLEFGHLKRGGKGFVAPKVHIKPVRDETDKLFRASLERVLNNV